MNAPPASHVRCKISVCVEASFFPRTRGLHTRRLSLFDTEQSESKRGQQLVVCFPQGFFLGRPNTVTCTISNSVAHTAHYQASVGVGVAK